MEPVYARFGQELRSLRRQKKLSQHDLARLLDPIGERLGRTSISNIEKGRQRVSLHLFLALARALDVDPADLLPTDPPKRLDVADRIPDLSEPEREWFERIVSSRSATHARGAST